MNHTCNQCKHCHALVDENCYPSGYVCDRKAISKAYKTITNVEPMGGATIEVSVLPKICDKDSLERVWFINFSGRKCKDFEKNTSKSAYSAELRPIFL